MVLIKKDESIPKEYITFFMGINIVNKYIKAGNDIILKRIGSNVSISLKTKKDINIKSSIIVVDMISMKSDGINVYNEPLINRPNIKFIGKCNHVCQYEILDNINLKRLYVH